MAVVEWWLPLTLVSNDFLYFLKANCIQLYNSMGIYGNCYIESSGRTHIKQVLQGVVDFPETEWAMRHPRENSQCKAVYLDETDWGLGHRSANYIVQSYHVVPQSYSWFHCKFGGNTPIHQNSQSTQTIIEYWKWLGIVCKVDVCKLRSPQNPWSAAVF